MNTTKFSIIIPVYNVAPYLRECLDSVLAQTFSDWECICVDDGSTDGSGAILDEYAAKDARFNVVHKTNDGVGAARNYALDLSKGEWVLFLDADDLLDGLLCQKLSDAIGIYRAASLFRFGYECFEDGGAISRSASAGAWHEVDLKCYKDISDFSFYAWQFAYKRALICDVSFPRYIRGEDRVFLLKVLCNKVDSYFATDDKLYYYRRRAGSAMNSRPNVQVLKDELSHRIDVVEIFDNSGKDEVYVGSYWLEKYCVSDYLILSEITGGYNNVERRELVDWFYRELPRLKKVKGYSKQGVVQVAAYDLFRFRIARYLISYFLPLWLHRAKVLVVSPGRVLKRMNQKLSNVKVKMV